MPASIWLKHRYKTYPALGSQDLGGFDVAVVGGGMAGLSAAYALVQKGLRPVVFERFRIGSGSTGFSGGFLTPNTTLDLWELQEGYGPKIGPHIYDLASDAVRQIEAASRTERIECGFRHTGAYYLAAEASHMRKIRTEYRAHRALGHNVSLIEDPGSLPLAGMYGALRTHNDCAIDPAAFAHGLAEAIVRGGGLILERTRVDDVIPAGTGAGVKIGKRVLPFARVVCLSVNGWPGLPEFNDRVRLMTVAMTSHILVTKPIQDIHKIWRRELMWDTYQMYHYLRFLPDGRVMVGGEDRWFAKPFHGAQPVSSRHDRRLMRFLRDAFPGTRIEPDFSWSGYLSFPIDGLPIIAEKDSIVHIVSDGLPFAWLIGHMAAERIAGKPHRDERLFHADRDLGPGIELFFRLPLPVGLKQACIKLGLAGYHIEDLINKTIRH